jgi:hypothetical protein
MSKGSGLFSGYAAKRPHVLAGHGEGVEIADVANSISASFAGMKAVIIEEWLAPHAASATALMAATATVNGPVTYTSRSGALVNPAAFANAARNLTITGGGTTGQCPTSAAVVGFDAGGNPQTETIALTAGSGTGVKGWSKITSIAFTGGTGTAGTESVGYGVVIGLSYAPKLRAGQTSPILPQKEIVDGAVLGPATGSIDTVNHTYTPAAAPNGTHNYSIDYEAVAS